MNPEDVQQLVEGRIAQAVESLADAKALLTSGRSGRGIVNRSYYAMFYCGDDYKRIAPVSLDEAREAVDLAERFLAAVQRHLAAGGHLPKG